jgi:hypothetical protein
MRSRSRCSTRRSIALWRGGLKSLPAAIPRRAGLGNNLGHQTGGLGLC